VIHRGGLAVFADRALPKSKSTRLAWIAALALSVALVLLPWVVKLDGKPHADWEQFLGRFHPLAVHLPIGLLVLLPILEIVGKFRPCARQRASCLVFRSPVACSH